MPKSTLHQLSLRNTQDCTTALRRWLAIDNNSAALMAHLRDAGRSAVAVRQRLTAELMCPVGTAQQLEPVEGRPEVQ